MEIRFADPIALTTVNGSPYQHQATKSIYPANPTLPTTHQSHTTTLITALAKQRSRVLSSGSKQAMDVRFKISINEPFILRVFLGFGNRKVEHRTRITRHWDGGKTKANAYFKNENSEALFPFEKEGTEKEGNAVLNLISDPDPLDTTSALLPPPPTSIYSNLFTQVRHKLNVTQWPNGIFG
ncbi:hypothetical protein VNO77_05815 [Canavalia gladiata]|uniref:Uncharacterized protein n=1 Tax=Canavalia gladiata TaxID=3824 RepID=A0AAN9R605_CANGL